MRKIIDGKIYDTETAELFYTFDPEESMFRDGKEYLKIYKKKNGEFFSHQKFIPQPSKESENIKTVSKEELINCLSPKLTEKEFTKLFGALEE